MATQVSASVRLCKRGILVSNDMALVVRFGIAAIIGLAAVQAQDGPQDGFCPAYPAAMRSELETSLGLDRAFNNYRKINRQFKPNLMAADTKLAQSANFIDQAIYGKMASDGVSPALPTTDSEFLRRAYLDLSGRIPSPDQAARFLDDRTLDKRAVLVEELLAAPAYSDQLTLFLTNRYKVTRAHDNISVPARETFYGFVHNLFDQDRAYDEWVRELISSAGEVDSAPGTQFFARWMDLAGPVQDSWDNITEKITTSFLGYKTECVSCHNGRAHLEKINLHLSKRTRLDFWKMSAFLSRMQFVRLSDDPIGFRPRVSVVDRSVGSYSGSVNPANPGCRPARVDAVVSPVMFTTKAEPTNGKWRNELGRMVTGDRQFARAAVNYIWSYLFGYGIVDPPDSWDMARVDPNNPPPGDWPMQNSNPELLEKLADYFIQNGYHFKPLIRQIMLSETYQLSSRYEGDWKPAFIRYFARYQPKRLTAEQMYDTIVTATHTEQPMVLPGRAVPLLFANQMPDPTEPSFDFRVMDFLNQFGRGNWWTVDRASEPTILGLLYMMNDSNNVNRSLGNSAVAVGITNRVREVDAKYPSDVDAINRLFLATLSRYPAETEMNLVWSRRSGPRYQWLSDLQWALINKLDFAFEY